MNERVRVLIEALDLRPHPEGGFYKELFRSASQVKPDDTREARSALTTIYFLLPQGSQSRWHRVQSDEVWHLYEGGPLELLELSDDRTDLARHRLAPISNGDDSPVHTIAAGKWQAARATDNYALVGCTVAPGFEFADFEMMADDSDLSRRVRDAWPDMATLI